MFAVGALLLVGPTVFLAVMHSSYDFYVWLISGPPPFDEFGSGPFQLWLVVGLGSGGILFLTSGVSLRLRRAGLRSGFPLLELVIGVPTGLAFLGGLALLIP